MARFLTGLLISLFAFAAFADPLPSWRDTEAKDRIIEFVLSVTDPTGETYVTPADRIAVFDNDGTLWAEQPVYFQLFFAMDRLAKMAADDPGILKSDALRAAAEGDIATVAQGGEKALLEVLNATHSGLSVQAFMQKVSDWLETARHPTTGLAYDKMTYQPMVELLRYLRDEGFRTYIVSGGGLDFMRVFAEDVYGIPPDQVLGTYTESAYEMVEGVPTLMKAPGIAFVDDKDGKPVNIGRVLGKRPILAGGNSDGDFAMLDWTTSGDGPRLGLIVHHTDADREFAYDRDSHIGRLRDGLDQGPVKGWLIIDMAKDWDRIYTGAR